ncbi:MAG: isoprenylcysteine carboxylmethyltransferase family protein [Rhodomicrobium sp.]|nr:isoprenylcysteine carboxylmethyltransferase family protein [Rhodomicrobium sp.]
MTGFVATFAFFTCFVIFLGNLPKLDEPWLSPTVDTGPALAPLPAALIDLSLIALFGLQHSLMARPWFKRWLTRAVPQPMERAAYVIAAALAGFIMLIFWQPIPQVLWSVSGAAAALLWSFFALGWAILLVSAINFGIFELLGLRQACAFYRGEPQPEPSLKTRGLYRWLGHPMYAGVLMGLWITPHMTVGHALIAAGLTVYIRIGMHYETRDLSRTFGAAWQVRRPPSQSSPARS